MRSDFFFKHVYLVNTRYDMDFEVIKYGNKYSKRSEGLDALRFL